MKNKPEAVETEAEELLFYSDRERDEALGTIGHLHIDFGKSGEEFNCTWFDHANSEKNDSHFKESFDMFIDDLRTGVLKSRAEMRKFCYGKDECRNSHSYTEDCWGFRVLSDRYAYYIRCTPGAGDYECYIYAYDKIHLMEFLAKEKKLPEHCYSRLASTGEAILIRYAEKGYYPITLPEGSTVEGMNESIGVTEAQRMAMEAGSMFGWRVPGADPKNYENKNKEDKYMENKNMLRVLIIEPEKKPYVKEIGSDLESLQHEVDGDIEAFYPTEDEVAFIVNEEGKINGLPLNRAIRNDDGVIIDIAAGNLLITGLGESDFASLDEERIKKYSERFRTPEMFLRVNGQLHVLPMPEPKPRRKHGEER